MKIINTIFIILVEFGYNDISLYEICLDVK